MSRSLAPRPTDAEMAILAVLWRRGRGTVRDVHEALDRVRPAAYTTTLKQMQVMHEKGLLRRDDAGRAHVYEPALPEERTLRRLAGDLLAHAFGGSGEKLVMHALRSKAFSADELARIRALIDTLEKEGKK
jgi:BlaI family transcriptional regulator, penicillinase repressor